MAISLLDGSQAQRAVPALVELLADCVAGGASVGFLHPLPAGRAEAFWRSVADGVSRGERLLLVARDRTGDLVGTVQLVLDQPDNQGHRADVTKLLVHRTARRQGVAGRLMAHLEDEARRRGRTLLVLDTTTGSAAQRLYERRGWQVAGVIPGYALSPDGRPEATTVLYLATP